ncbi:hypothetical protein F0562_016117 [Nyssa sinensis]|uniref:Homeobox-leucine zipper protein n=1 Tax=Nyssa sinensis TaxID=561372 RepID=A0A5J4ZIP2_9ASTE|nr:hypothetical protein F0562_016117 [Nyssa sinensis]
MDWNGNLKPFVSLPENSFAFLCNYNCDHQYPGIEMKHPVVAQGSRAVVPAMEKKKRLTSEQLESLESSFQEEIKLDPERKMKLALELGLNPRQVAVWFQNRRARWKAKQLEHLYDALKRELNVVSREKHKLQEEVLALKAMLKEQAAANKKLAAVSAGYTEISGTEETVESTSVVNRSTSQTQKLQERSCHGQQIAENNFVFNIEDYTTVMLPAYWGVLPSSSHP